jgi:hypothetical protein
VLYRSSSPPSTPVSTVTGQWLSKNRRSRWARARLAADILAGKVQLSRLTAKQVAALCRVNVARVHRARNGRKPKPSLAEHLASSTPAERLEAAKALGVDRVWDQMVLSLVGTAAAAE